MELWLFEFRTTKSVEVVAAEVVMVAVRTNSMGNSNIFGFLLITSLQPLGLHRYSHDFGLNVRLNNFAIFQIIMKSLALGLAYKISTIRL